MLLNFVGVSDLIVLLLPQCIRRCFGTVDAAAVVISSGSADSGTTFGEGNQMLSTRAILGSVFLCVHFARNSHLYLFGLIETPKMGV